MKGTDVLSSTLVRKMLLLGCNEYLLQLSLDRNFFGHCEYGLNPINLRDTNIVIIMMDKTDNSIQVFVNLLGEQIHEATE